MKHSIVLFGVLIAVPGAAIAQAPPAPATPPAQTVPPAPMRAANCTPMHPAPQQGTAAPEGTTTGQHTEPLGTPDTGNTPVIPPPGSPGGDPTVRPK